MSQPLGMGRPVADSGRIAVETTGPMSDILLKSVAAGIAGRDLFELVYQFLNLLPDQLAPFHNVSIRLRIIDVRSAPAFSECLPWQP